MAFLFNYSFTVGEVPKSLKIPKVIPIYKKVSKVTMSNYLPISFLTIFSKIMEKLMYNRLIDYFQKNIMLSLMTNLDFVLTIQLRKLFS